MTDVNHNGIDDVIEAQEYKARAVNAKFKQQISYGIGAAMVFGLVSALGSLLKDSAVEAFLPAGGGLAAAALPIIGLVGLGIVGIGLLYLSAKYLSENTVLDQDLQAKQISAAAARGRVPVIERAVEPKTQGFPETSLAKADMPVMNTPTTSIGNERKLVDTIIARNDQLARVA